MTNQLKGLFGGGSDDHAQAQAKVADFAAKYKQGSPHEGYSQEEAKEALGHVLKTASPEQLQTAVKATYNNLPEDSRKELAQMIQDRQQGKNLVKIDTSSSGATASTSSSGDNPLSDLFGQVLGSSGGGSGDLGGLLGGLLGGSSGSGGGLGGILGGLLGGGSKSTSTTSNATASGGGDLTSLLGEILSGPQGKAILGGIAAFAADAETNKK